MGFHHKIEKGLFASRWLLAPFYVGLVFALAVLLVKFTQEIFHFAPGVFVSSESDVLLFVLTLIDLSLTGNLLLMVIFAGYENFVSHIDVGEDAHRPSWMGTVDFSGLKIKLIGSIVAISGVHLLKQFMNMEAVNKEDLKWLLLTHAAFVTSGVLLALMDYFASKTKVK
ncbi:MAG: TIGR00645 family protein [Burkholderiales bacterium]|jgi:uncharacterized protein (TIGR00645 family)|nr:TIGR00645 family protein [Pseudomonadota bacterium]